MTTIWARAEALLKNDLDSIESFFTGDVWPAIKTFFQTAIEEEIAAIVPILENALPAILKDPLALFTASGWNAVSNQLVTTVIPQIEATGKQVASASIHAAVGAVLANAQAAASATQARAPATPAAS